MKKLLTSAMLLMTIGVYTSVFAQCTIASGNTTPGFTPTTPANVIQGIAYSQTEQVYVPDTYLGYTIDSIHITGITSAPTGIIYTLNPESGVINGGQNGAICFSGTTSAAMGTYPLTIEGDAYTSSGLVFPGLGNFTLTLIVIAPTPPTSVFFPNLTRGCTPMIVDFADESTNSPTSWTWTFGDGTSSTLSNPTHTYTRPGTFTVTETVTNASGSNSSTTTITVNPSPQAAITVTDASSSSSSNGSIAVTMTAGTPPFSFTWSNTATSQNLTNVSPGTYYVAIIDSNYCDVIDTVMVYVTGVNALSDEVAVKIYPNPASDVLNFQWSLDDEVEVVMYDLAGNKIRSFTIRGNDVNRFDIHGLVSGAYVILVTDKQNSGQRSMLFSKF